MILPKSALALMKSALEIEPVQGDVLDGDNKIIRKDSFLIPVILLPKLDLELTILTQLLITQSRTQRSQGLKKLATFPIDLALEN